MAYSNTIQNFSHRYGGVRGLFDVEMFVGDSNNPADIRANIQLIIRLKINLEQDNIGTTMNDSLRGGYRFTNWPSERWENFRSTFISQARYWDNKLWLVLDDARRSSGQYKSQEHILSMSTTRQLHIQELRPRVVSCRFIPELADAANAHYTLRVTYIVDANDRPLPVNADSAYVMRSNSGHIDNGDIYDPNTIAHEIGHRLGLPHIGVMRENSNCLHAENHNAAVCYTDSDPALTNNIMGQGTNMDWRDAVPWRVALESMTRVPLGYYFVHTIPYTSAIYRPEIYDTRVDEIYRSLNRRAY